MNKKIAALIAGILLILAGVALWYGFNKDNNLDEQTLEDIKLNGAAVQKTDNLKEENPATEQSKKIIKKNISSKAAAPRPQTKVIINLPEPEIKVTPMFEETVAEEKELEDPYVDQDGNVIVRNEFKPAMKQRIKFRGVVYNIKTRLTEPKN